MPYAAVPKPASNKSPRTLYLGLMSGTSLDGVDAVLVDFFDPSHPTVCGHRHAPFAAPLRDALAALCRSGANEVERAYLLSSELSRCYARLVMVLLHGLGVPSERVEAMGCHGQTVRHRPGEGYSVQLVNGALLAELSGIAVVTDFRARDLAAGGQGAPLVPAFHEALLRHPTQPRLVLNLGGIANLTCLLPGEVTTGYDIGPANTLMDAWIRRHLGLDYDRDGEWAASGVCQEDILSRCLEHPFFLKPPPKSTGWEDFNLSWLASITPDLEARPPQDIQCTLLELTARSVTHAVRQEVAGRADVVEMLVCGGGALNGALMRRMSMLLPNVRVTTTESVGLPVQQVEACAFAWLAWAHTKRVPGNLPAVTGARHAAVLGACYPA